MQECTYAYLRWVSSGLGLKQCSRSLGSCLHSLESHLRVHLCHVTIQRLDSFHTKCWVPQSASRLLTLQLGRITYRRPVPCSSLGDTWEQGNGEMEKRRKGTERLWEILSSCDFGAKVPSSSTRSVALDTWHLFVWSSKQIAWCELIRLLALTMPLSISRICFTIILYVQS